MKDFLRRHRAEVIAAVVVLGCAAYFNFVQRDWPVFIIGGSYGWPLTCREMSYVLYGGNSPHRISRDDWSAVNLALNGMAALGLVGFSAWGVITLRRINGSLWRIHLQTAVVLMLLTGAVLGVQFQERALSGRYPDQSVYGWPYETLSFVRSPYVEAGTIRMNIAWGSLARNAFVTLLALFAAIVASEIFLARRRKKP